MAVNFSTLGRVYTRIPSIFALEGGVTMDIQAIGTLISTVGFPIAIVCYLLYYQKDTTDKLSVIISENTKIIELLKQEIHEHFMEKGKNAA